LPEDYIDTVKQVLKNLKAVIWRVCLEDFAGRLGQADQARLQQRQGLRPLRDHPDARIADKLDDIERKVYDMVAKRFLSVFYPAAQFEVTTRITRVEGEPFKTDGKILVFPGWLEIYGREEQDADDQAALVPVQENETVKTQEIEVKGLETRLRRGTRKRRCSARWKARAS